MATLIACLGEGKGTWTNVFKLATMPDWEHVIFIGPGFVKERLQLKENMRFVEVDDRQPIPAMTDQIANNLGTLFGEVGLNLTSGNGALHMAVLAAILRTGGGIRLVHHDNNYQEIT